MGGPRVPAEVRQAPIVDVRKLSLLACGLLVLLRMSIGWQFFYEGIWKLNTLSSTEAWTSAGYLKAAKGPFRNTFRNMVGDPDDLDLLDYDKVIAKWDAWKQAFLAQHPDLAEAKKKQLDKEVAALKSRLKETLENPEWAGIIREKFEGTIDYKTIGEIELYKNMLARYEANLKKAAQDFQREHLDKQWKEIQEKRAMLTGPINALTKELHALPGKILDVTQMSRGPVPLPKTSLQQIDKLTMWSLTVVGMLLLAGLFSRFSALAAAGLLTMFYLVVPPWPGVPEAPGPEHSLIVNKNFIEIVACLALASMPSGRWVGLDALVRRFILRKKTD
jgi:uncharacterized membrane protein YphA (DoxX/SURF4 family)